VCWLAGRYRRQWMALGSTHKTYECTHESTLHHHTCNLPPTWLYPVGHFICDHQVYTSEELREAFAALIQQRHSEIRDAGKEITKLLSSSNRVLKVCARVCALTEPWSCTCCKPQQAGAVEVYQVQFLHTIAVCSYAKTPLNTCPP
jgi:hypothetical protein